MKEGRFFLRILLGENRPTAWMAPLLAVVTLFYLYPAVEVLRFSVTNTSLLEANYKYTLNTFVRVLTEPELYNVLRVTLLFVIGSLGLQMSLALLIALAVNRIGRRRLPGAVFVRTLVLTAWVMPGVVIGIVWSLVLNEASYGLFNSVLATFGLGSVAFLSNPQNALMSVIIANVWRGTAFSMILQYAGLQSIPDELYEAAAVDGASKLQSFWHITLPQLRPILLINIVLGTIYTFNTFDMILALTGGGPGRATEVIALRAYNVIFQDYSLAEGAVLAVIMLVITLGLTLGYRRLLRSEGAL
jgi:multiple sugar transport system permease protein